MTTKSEGEEWAPNDVWDTTWGAVQYKYVEMAAREIILRAKQKVPIPEPDIDIPKGLPSCTQEKDLIEVLWKYCRLVRLNACRLQRAAAKEKETAEAEILKNYWLEEKGHEMPKELEPIAFVDTKKKISEQKAYKARDRLRSKNAKESDLSMYVLLRDGIRPLAPTKKRKRDAFEMLLLATRSVLGTDKHLLPSLNLRIPEEKKQDIKAHVEKEPVLSSPAKKIRTVDSIFPPEPPLSEAFCRQFLAQFQRTRRPLPESKHDPGSSDLSNTSTTCMVCVRRGLFPPWKFIPPAKIHAAKNLQLAHPEVYATLDLARCKIEGVDLSKLTCLSTEEAFWSCTHKANIESHYLMDLLPPPAAHSWGEPPWLRINNWKLNPNHCPMCQIVRDPGNRFLRRQLWSIAGLLFEREKQLDHMLSIWDNPLRCDAYVHRTPTGAPVVFESDHPPHFPEMKEGELLGPRLSIRGNDRVKNVCLVWAGIHLLRYSERLSEPIRAQIIRKFLRDCRRLPKGQILVRLVGLHRWEYDEVYWMDAFRFSAAPIVEQDGLFTTEMVLHLNHIDHQLHDRVKHRLHEIVRISGQPQQYLFPEIHIAMKMRRDPFHVTTTVWEELFG
jgi:hypothetical protein